MLRFTQEICSRLTSTKAHCTDVYVTGVSKEAVYEMNNEKLKMKNPANLIIL